MTPLHGEGDRGGGQTGRPVAAVAAGRALLHYTTAATAGGRPRRDTMHTLLNNEPSASPSNKVVTAAGGAARGTRISHGELSEIRGYCRGAASPATPFLHGHGLGGGPGQAGPRRWDRDHPAGRGGAGRHVDRRSRSFMTSLIEPV